MINTFKGDLENAKLYISQFSSVAQSCLTLYAPLTIARQAFLFITNS